MYPNLTNRSLFRWLAEVDEDFLTHEYETQHLPPESLEDFLREEGVRLVDGVIVGMRVA